MFLPIYAELSVTIYLLWFTLENGILDWASVYVGTTNNFWKVFKKININKYTYNVDIKTKQNTFL